ncbi:alpha/beta hydrolase [Pollutimonas harenae]|uniref:Alpha/beta hydrolase n=1 Tax=Pollutimonas harenae TaxID=657015 RepID=A0A853H1G4_9BURK|nr:alpha/beta hydrolase [Pollutimonas harenae]NYT84413.1 alpha/beta hydrolase [Pollutimonas harenae]TEA73186.1 alpha/beta hydrolase [Pollutimonas harenae]
MAQDLYCNRDFIPDFDEIVAETAARSRELSSQVDLRPDVPYGPGPRERMDIILPPHPAKGAPLHVFIHGGYWRSGSKEAHRLIAAPVLAAGGIAAVVTYDLMPGTRLGTIVGQVRSAIRHLAAIAPDLGADATRLTVSGHSAGAHLTSYLASIGPEENTPQDLPALRALLLVSGIYDLTDIPGSFLKDEAKMTPAEASAWSPLSSQHLPGPKRTVMVSELDTPPFHTQGQQLVSLLNDSGLEGKLRTEAGLNHMTIVLALADPKSATGQCLADLVSC